jgi:bacterioferritin
MSAKESKSEARTSAPFLTDIEEIRRRAREHMMEGAVTSGYKADREAVLRVLNDVLATEIVCVLRYKRHQYMAAGIHARSVAEEFAEHAQQEQEHADRVAERIVQLDGEPDLSPEGLATRAHTRYVEGKSLPQMVEEDLVAERIVIQTYSEVIRYLGNDDPTTRRLLEEVNAQEEEHAEELKTLLESLSKDERFGERS